MTVLAAQAIRRLGLISPCLPAARDERGNSYGLSACGYDIRIAQSIRIRRQDFMLVSSMERFSLPTSVMGVVHDKSSLARRGLSVLNTVLEPGWQGFLTLELSMHGGTPIFFAAGDAVAQVIFHYLDEPTKIPYAGKYQNQAEGPQEARS